MKSWLQSFFLGQGYLSINRFGTVFASAHAGMTAEGDNSVLMQKVAKEHMGLFKPEDISTWGQCSFGISRWYLIISLTESVAVRLTPSFNKEGGLI